MRLTDFSPAECGDEHNSHKASFMLPHRSVPLVFRDAADQFADPQRVVQRFGLFRQTAFEAGGGLRIAADVMRIFRIGT